MHAIPIFYIKNSQPSKSRKDSNIIWTKLAAKCVIQSFSSLNTEKFKKKLLLIGGKLKILPSISLNTWRILGLSCRSVDIYSLRCFRQIWGEPNGAQWLGHVENGNVWFAKSNLDKSSTYLFETTKYWRRSLICFFCKLRYSFEIMQFCNLFFQNAHNHFAEFQFTLLRI